jgi:hypothetical protein
MQPVGAFVTKCIVDAGPQQQPLQPSIPGDWARSLGIRPAAARDVPRSVHWQALNLFAAITSKEIEPPEVVCYIGDEIE